MSEIITATASQTATTALTFSQQLDSWHDFYIVLGGASATLVGLLFIAISLNADLITNRAQAPLRAVASNTFISFLLVLVYSLFLLFPDTSADSVKSALLGISAIGTAHVLHQAYIALRSVARHINLLTMLRRFLLPSLAYIYIIYESQQLSDSEPGHLVVLAVVFIVLLGTATSYAWDWLIGVGQNKGDSKIAALVVPTVVEQEQIEPRPDTSAAQEHNR